tara:strand:+ start:123 stop:302 length:180 start_codon:yes stop_codon:yes gene_type:complete
VEVQVLSTAPENKQGGPRNPAVGRPSFLSFASAKVDNIAGQICPGLEHKRYTALKHEPS